MLTSKINARTIAISSLLVSIGVVCDLFIRINRFPLLTHSIYIVIALVLPLSLALISAVLIDVLALTFRGFIGGWWWSLQIEPIIIVIVVVLIKMIFSRIETIRTGFIVLGSILLVAIGFLIYSIIVQPSQFSFNYLSGENTAKYVLRLIKRYVSLIGVGTISIGMIIFNLKKKNIDSLFISSIILISVFLIDMIYHPFAVYNWYQHVLGIEKNAEWYKIVTINGYWRGVINSFFGLSISLPIYKVIKNKVI